jgi:hypothetical protein
MNEYIIEHADIFGIKRITISADTKHQARQKFWSTFKNNKTVKFLKWIN